MKNKQPLTTLEVIEKAQYPIITAPFFGVDTPIKLRELTQAQLMSCGDFSLIETFQDKVNKKKIEKNPSMKQVYQYAETMHNIARESLMAPTYDEIFEIIGVDPKIEKKKKELKELKELLRKTPQGLQRKELEEEVYSYEAFINLLLPNDFLNFIMCYVLGIEKSDIKKISEDMLLNAAIMAERGNDNPANHIDGIFTSFMKEDINKRAWIILQEKRSQKNKMNFKGLVKNGG